MLQSTLPILPVSSWRARARAHTHTHTRHALQSKRAASADGSDIPAIPVTVRQLEAVIRIAESLAKMNLQVGASSSNVVSICALWCVREGLGPCGREWRLAGAQTSAGAVCWRLFGAPVCCPPPPEPLDF